MVVCCVLLWLDAVIWGLLLSVVCLGCVLVFEVVVVVVVGSLGCRRGGWFGVVAVCWCLVGFVLGTKWLFVVCCDLFV